MYAAKAKSPSATAGETGAEGRPSFVSTILSDFCALVQPPPVTVSVRVASTLPETTCSRQSWLLGTFTAFAFGKYFCWSNSEPVPVWSQNLTLGEFSEAKVVFV